MMMVVVVLLLTLTMMTMTMTIVKILETMQMMASTTRSTSMSAINRKPC